MLSFTLGACVGSYLNVCIYRIPRELSTVTPRSFCPNCNKQIPWYYNIPLVSYLMLRAKSKCCGREISFRYFLVELLTAMLFLFIWLKFDNLSGPRAFALAPVTDWRLIPVFWLVAGGLILGTFVDFEHLIIPDRVTLGGIVAGLVLSFALPSLHAEEKRMMAIFYSLLGTIVGGGILWGLAIVGKIIFRKDAMGFGDVKLLGAIGAFLGTKAVLFTIFLSSLVGSIVGIIFVVSNRKTMGSRIPYGPYLALAAIIWILWGDSIWNSYINFLIPPEKDILVTQPALFYTNTQFGL